MKRILAVIVTVLVCFSACKKKEVDTIATIKKKREKINNELGKYKLVTVEDIVSKEQGIIEGYFRDEEAKKVRIQYFGVKSRNFTDYYFDDGMLIYVASEDYIYNQPNTYTEEKAVAVGDSDWYDDKKTVLEINKYYFSDNKLIKWTGAGENDTPLAIGEFPQRESQIIAKALIGLKQLKASSE